MTQHKRLPKDSSPKVAQRDKIEYELKIRERDDLTEKQKAFLELVLDGKTQLVLVDAPAGTGKTYLAILAALRALNSKRIGQIIYARTIIESASKSIGSLPGFLEEKLNPFLMPLQDKLDELLGKQDVDKLFKDERVKGIPINFLRGANFNATFLVLDESQNATLGELSTVITRQGKYSKFILCGDSRQSDLNGKSGFKELFDVFNTEECQNNGIYCVQFTSDDIVRSGIVKFIVEKLDEYNKSKHKKGVK